MRVMQLEFDAAKNQINIATRGLSFERAADFDFGTAVIDQDTRKANAREVRNYDQTRTTD